MANVRKRPTAEFKTKVAAWDMSNPQAGQAVAAQDGAGSGIQEAPHQYAKPGTPAIP